MTNKSHKRSAKPISWSVNAAALEFGVDRSTLRRRLTDAQATPDAKGEYSTRQICSAAFGDLHAEKLATHTAQRRLAELEVKRQERVVLPVKDVERAWSFLLQGVRTRWLQLPARSVVAFPLWPDARAAEAWFDAEVQSILKDLASNPDYTPIAEDADQSDDS